MKSRISGKEAVYVARESDKRRPIRLLAPEGGEQPPGALVPSELSEDARQAPPRVLKPSPLNDQCVAPTPDLESHRKRLREAFGNTMSDEFVEVLLGKLLEALRPAALESLEQPTVNAALAIIDSMSPSVRTGGPFSGANHCGGFFRATASSTKPAANDPGLHRRLWQLRHQAPSASK